MTTKDFGVLYWRLLSSLNQQVNESMTIFPVKAKNVFLPRHCHFLNVLTQFNLWGDINLYQFVNTAQCRLALASYQMSAYAKAVNLVSLLIKGPDGFLVDVIGRNDGQVTKPRFFKPKKK